MYEVQNRSIDEHDQYSFGIERKNLKFLYKANLDFVQEMKRINNLDNLVAHGKLNGSIYKQSTLTNKRKKGILALAGAIGAYSKMTALTMMVGSNVATLGIVAAAYYGMMQFYDNHIISQVDFITEGEHAGKMRMKVHKSPFSSTWVIVHPRNSRSVISL